MRLGVRAIRIRSWLLAGGLLLQLLAAAVQVPGVAAQAAPGASAWLSGPSAAGDAGSLAGVIDLPRANAVVSGGTLQVAGWFVDQSAQGWAGADDVEIFLGTMDSGRPLAHAQFAQSRPDVGAALHNSFWSQSGWAANVAVSALPPGSQTLAVYVHTPSRGWWFRQVSVSVRGPPPPARAAAPLISPNPTVPPAPVLGYDLSSPQCPTGAEPGIPAFGLVGVNSGLAFTGNPCLARQYVWALTSASPTQAHVGFYVNTANPGPVESQHWPAAGTLSPQACDGSWSAGCAYDYGWDAAQDSYARGVGVSGAAAAARDVWWLDVEAANSWSTDPSSNVAVLQGAVAALRSVGVGSIGVYSTSTDWSTITGLASANGAAASPFASLLNWEPGAQSAQDAPAWCARTVTGGRVKFVQFPSAGFDADFACF